MPSPNTVRFTSGPWNGVRYTIEPYDEQPNLLHDLQNGVLEDPEAGCSVGSRLGFWLANQYDAIAPATQVSNVQASYTHTGLDGTVTKFTIADGVIYDGNAVDVTPSNVAISATAPRVFLESLGDTLIVNDGVNTPWLGTNLTGSPITATPIVFSPASTLLLMGTNNVRVAYQAFEFLVQGTYGTKVADLVGVALPAGTIPTDTWGAFTVYCSSGGVITVLAADDNFTTGYASEADAIAARPSDRGSAWTVGYFTVKTAVGQPFVCGTDALQGGTGGNPSSDTNYYSGTAPAWKAYGQPVIYAGSVVFVLDTVDGGPAGAARTSIAWSEPNLPDEGYRQTDYDNVWQLTQTGSDPLYALAATNDALYYSRAYGWGALAGAPNVNWQNTATHDVVAGNIGCISPSSVRVFRNYVYFCDALGRPYRFAVGGTPEPLWHQMRQWFVEVRGTYTLQNVEQDWWAVIEPNANLYVFNAGGDPFNPSVTGVEAGLYWMHVFDANTGLYLGRWRNTTLQFAVDDPTPVMLGAVVNTLGGSQETALSLFTPKEVDGGPDISIIEAQQYTPTGPVWSDEIFPVPVSGNDTRAVTVAGATQWLGFGVTDNTVFTESRLLAWREGSVAPVVTMAVDTTQGLQTPQAVTATGGGVAAGSVVGYSGDRYVANLPRTRMGRGGRVVFSVAAGTTTANDDTGQVVLHRIEADAVVSGTTVRDR